MAKNENSSYEDFAEKVGDAQNVALNPPVNGTYTPTYSERTAELSELAKKVYEENQNSSNGTNNNSNN